MLYMFFAENEPESEVEMMIKHIVLLAQRVIAEM